MSALISPPWTIANLLLRRKEIYETLHPETRNGGDRRSEKIRSAKCASDSAKSFVDDTAEKLDVAPSTVRRQLQTARDLTPETKGITKDAKITKTDALKLSRLSPEQQAHFSPPEVEYSNPGVIRAMSTSQLTSGLPYQRPIKPQDVKRIIREWNPRKLTPVIVSFRDGKFNVVDGQHHIEAMRQMAGGKDVIVPCIIYTGMTYEDEAAMYASLEPDVLVLAVAPWTRRSHLHGHGWRD